MIFLFDFILFDSLEEGRWFLALDICSVVFVCGLCEVCELVRILCCAFWYFVLCNL